MSKLIIVMPVKLSILKQHIIVCLFSKTELQEVTASVILKRNKQKKLISSSESMSNVSIC